MIVAVAGQPISMPATKKRRPSLTTLLPVTCSSCGSTCLIEVNNFTEKSIDDIECETFSFIVCAACTPAVEALERPSALKRLTVFTSHINPSVVQFSSHPDIVPVSSFISCSNAGTFACRSLDLDGAVSRMGTAALDIYEAESCYSSLEEGYSTARSWFHSADAILIIAGAGMSAESGLSTFRYQLSNDSPQNKVDSHLSPHVSLPAAVALLGGGLSTSEVCYNTRPEKAWYYDASIRRDSLTHSPHDGYTLLLNALQEQHKDFMVLTSNIDNYFIRAKYPPESVYETHGSINLIQCGKLTNSGRCVGVWKWKDLALYDQLAPILDDNLLECNINTTPLCPTCGGATRANISHESDCSDDIDQSVKNIQRKNLWSWLRKFRECSGPGSESGKSSIVFPLREKNDYKKRRGKKLRTDIKAKDLLNILPDSLNIIPPKKLLIIEIGCGDTIHGLRHESELLLSSHPISGITCSKLIRINPNLNKLCLKEDKKDSIDYNRNLDKESNKISKKNKKINEDEKKSENNNIESNIKYKSNKKDSDRNDSEHSWESNGRILELQISALQALQNIFN